MGLAACALGVLFGLTRVSALGVPYLRDAVFPEVPLSPDGVTRRSYPKLSWRPFTIGKNEVVEVGTILFL